jgi:WD40-like Beta Propeller Repeat
MMSIMETGYRARDVRLSRRRLLALGTALLFESEGFTSTGGPRNSAQWIGADGSGRRTIAQGGRFPSLAPDGREVAYVRNSPVGDSLFVRPLDGGDERQIVPEDRFLVIEYPRYSPDGTTIAFAGVLPFQPLTPKLMPGRHGLPVDLYVVSRAGTDIRQAASLAFDDKLGLAWSPDGARLAAGGLPGLVLVRGTDGSTRQVTVTGSFGGLDWR